MPRNVLEVKVKHEKKEDIYFALNEMRIDYGYTTQVIDVYIMMNCWKCLEEMVCVFQRLLALLPIINLLVGQLFIQEHH